MRIANTKICVKKGTMSMKENDEKIEFKVFEESKLPQDELECFNVCMIQGVVENTFQDHQINPLEATLTHSVTRKDMEPVFEDDTEDIMEVVQPLETFPSHPGAQKKQQLNELKELRHKVDENTKLYKGRTKTDHDKNHAKKEFHVGQKLWTYKSRLQLPLDKLKNRWFDPCVVINVFPHGVLEVHSPQRKQTYKVNGHRTKPYIEVNSTPRALELHLVDFKCIFSKE
jgi:hypothetical protein